MKQLHIDCELDYIANENTNFVFNIQIAMHEWQKIQTEKITTLPDLMMQFGLNHIGNNRLIKLCDVNGPISIRYEAEIDVDYPLPSGNEIENKMLDIPIEITPYLWSSRYCNVEKIAPIALELFGSLTPGYARVNAINEWIFNNVVYEQGSTNSATTAIDVINHKKGVCRDFAHLGIGFCRALNIPARFVGGYANLKSDTNDFHAIFEVYLSNRWVLFDPTKLSNVTEYARVATGFDAADSAFSTIYGSNVQMNYFNPSVQLKA